MTLLLLIFLLTMLTALFFKQSIVEKIGSNNKLVTYLKRAGWFQNHWQAGLFLFAMNAVLCSLTSLLLYGVIYLAIPYIHLIIMLLSVIASGFLWIIIYHAWQGSRKNRLKLGFVGSSFYLMLTIAFVYWFMTLEPTYSGEDLFIAAVGLIMAIVITAIAFITCFAYTGFAKKGN